MNRNIDSDKMYKMNLIATLMIDSDDSVELIIEKNRFGMNGTYKYSSREDFLKNFPDIPEIKPLIDAVKF